jgi:hypothetical protein
MVLLNGALSRESDTKGATTIATESVGLRPEKPLHTTPSSSTPPPREAWHIPRHHHGAASKSPATPNPTTVAASDQHQCQGREGEQPVEEDAARTLDSMGPPESCRKARIQQDQGSRPPLQVPRHRPGPPAATTQRPKTTAAADRSWPPPPSPGFRTNHDRRPHQKRQPPPHHHQRAPPPRNLRIRLGRRRIWRPTPPPPPRTPTRRPTAPATSSASEPADASREAAGRRAAIGSRHSRETDELPGEESLAAAVLGVRAESRRSPLRRRRVK